MPEITISLMAHSVGMEGRADPRCLRLRPTSRMGISIHLKKMDIDLEKKRSLPSRVDYLETEILSDGHFRLERLTLRNETFVGTMAPPVKREVLRSGRSVAVLLFDPAADKLVLTEQFRIGADLNGLPAWLIECVAGMVDEGETPEQAARREVQEETGCEVTRVEPIGRYLTSPGITDELAFVFVGMVDAERAGGVHGEASEAEDIRTLVFPVEEALAAMDSGAIGNVVAQVALLWFARNGDALRERWSRSNE